MTTKIDEQIISVARKKHPNEARYVCRRTYEILNASMKFLSTLTPEQMNMLQNGSLIIDEDETAELYDAFKEKDVIGLGIARSNGFFSNRYTIEKIIPDSDYMICQNMLTKEQEEITFQDVSIGFALGFAEILYRDEKPFGVSDTMEVRLKIHHNNENGAKAEDTSVESVEIATTDENSSEPVE